LRGGHDGDKVGYPVGDFAVRRRVGRQSGVCVCSGKLRRRRRRRKFVNNPRGRNENRRLYVGKLTNVEFGVQERNITRRRGTNVRGSTAPRRNRMDRRREDSQSEIGCRGRHVTLNTKPDDQWSVGQFLV